MATASTTTKPKPAAQPAVQLSPELEAFVMVKLGRPRNLWRWLNRVYAFFAGAVSRDEWDVAFDTALKSVEGRTMYPEDAAKRVEKMLAAQLDLQDKGRAHASCAKCERSDTAIVIAFIGRPQSGFFHSRAITLKEPEKRRG